MIRYEEFKAAEGEQFKTGPYSMWPRPAPFNTKGSRGYTDDNAAHIWKKLDVHDHDTEDADVEPDSKVCRTTLK